MRGEELARCDLNRPRRARAAQASYRRQSASYKLPPDLHLSASEGAKGCTRRPIEQPSLYGRKSSRPPVGSTPQGGEVRPPVNGLGQRVALFIECPLAHLVSTHCFVEGPGREIGAQDADAEP